jgi:hypothetical protein
MLQKCDQPAASPFCREAIKGGNRRSDCRITCSIWRRIMTCGATRYFVNQLTVRDMLRIGGSLLCLNGTEPCSVATGG